MTRIEWFAQNRCEEMFRLIGWPYDDYFPKCPPDAECVHHDTCKDCWVEWLQSDYKYAEEAKWTDVKSE